jgi:reactive intermediate/imine deaminase
MKRTALLPVIALLAVPLLAPNALAQEPVFHPRQDDRPFSAAVEVGETIYLSGQIGFAADGKGVVPGGIEAEARRTMELIGEDLARLGLGYDDLVKCTVMLADMNDWPAFNAIYAGYFKPGHYPARSALGANGLALGARVEVECIAWAGSEKQAAAGALADPLDRALQTLALIAIEDDSGHREFTVTNFATAGCTTTFSGKDAELKVDWSKTSAASLSDGFLFVQAPPQQFALLIDPERKGEWDKLVAAAGVLTQKVTDCGGRAGPVR